MRNKKSNILVSSLALVAIVLLAFVFFIRPAFSASEKFTVKFDIHSSIAHQTLYITITNNQDTSDNLDLKTIIKETNFDTQQVRNMQFYELKDVDYTITDYETVCNEKEEANGSITQNCERKTIGSHIETRKEWKQRKLTSNQVSDQEIRHQWEQVAIGKVPKNVKRFKLEFDTPIVRNGAGWGSAGTVYLEMNGQTYVDKSASSWWNLNCEVRRQFNVTADKNVTDFPTIVILNSTNFDYNKASTNEVWFVDSNDIDLAQFIEVWNSAGNSYVHIKANYTDGFSGYYYYNCTGVSISSDVSKVYDNLYAFYGAEENSNDYTNTLNLTIYGDVTYNSTYQDSGRFSFQFGGTDDNLYNTTDYVNSTDATYCLWFYQDSVTATDQTLIFTEPASQATYLYYRTKANTGEVFLHWENIAYDDIYYKNYDVSGAWHHSCMRLNGTTESLFLDGAEVNKTTNAGPMHASDDLHIGAHRNTLWEFKGVMDNIMLFTDVKSDDFIYLAANKPALTFGAEETPPVTWSNNQTNASATTKYGESVYFNVTFSDGVPDKYIFSTNNSGSWANTTPASWTSGVPVQNIITVNQTRGKTISWYFWANNTAGKTNTTDIWSFTVANTEPEAPQLNAPANNTGSDTLSEFNWTNSVDADNDNISYYIIQVDNNSDFSSPEYTNNSVPEDVSGITGVTPTGFDINLDNTLYWHVRAYDGYDNGSWSQNWTFVYANWSITFNLTDSVSGELIQMSGNERLSISCDDVLNTGPITNNPYTATDAFPSGDYSCDFTADRYLSKTQNITADNDKTVQIPMSESGGLTAEEHNWLEALYDCLIGGDCTAFKMWNATNITVGNIWQRVVRTNTDVITQEEFISSTLNATSNITINYTVDIPLKEGYETNELLPLRMFFWFTDPGKTECYNQDKRNDSNRAEDPYCMPLVAETLGPNGGSVTFTVDLRPDLPDDTYNVTRSIEIDPLIEGERTWINYGQEDIGMITVENAQGEPDIVLTKTSETEVEPESKAGITGQAVKDFISNKGNIIVAWLALITLLLVYQIFFRKRK